MAGPLDHGTLREIEQCLQEGQLDAAQERLAAVDPNSAPTDGVAYLATRLLYHRGRLTAGDAAERIRELLAQGQPFPEAQTFVGELGIAPKGEQRSASAAPPLPEPVESPRAPVSTPPNVNPAKSNEFERAETVELSSIPPEPSSLPPAHFEAQAAGPIPTPHNQRPITPVPGKRPGPPLPPSRRMAQVNPVVPRTERRDTPPLGSRSSEQPAAPQRPASAPLDDEIPQILSPISDLTGLDPSEPAPPSAAAPLIPKAPPVPALDPPRRASSQHPIASRSSLPQGAGRYSEAPRRSESIRPGVSRPPGQSARPGSEPIAKESTPPTAAEAVDRAATLITEERFAEALEILDRADFPDPSMRARAALLRSEAFAGLDFHQQAVSELTLLEQDPKLQAEHRAHGAELLAEMGQYERAIEQAVKALDGSDGSAEVRLRFATVIVRAARHRDDDFLMEQANRALSNVRANANKRALLLGLRACLLARIGDAERALEQASEALRIDPKAPDAVAAACEAACRTRDFQAAKVYLQSLKAVSPAEAQALTPRLTALGLTPGAFPSESPDHSPRSSRPALGQPLATGESSPRPAIQPNFRSRSSAPPPERRRSEPPRGSTRPSASPTDNLAERCTANLISGNRGAALEILRTLARERASRMPRAPSDSEPPEVASTAATFLTQAPIFNAFPPYDLSLFSIARLEAALDCLLGSGSWPQPLEADDPLLIILGSYLGETLRQAHQGRWSKVPGVENKSRIVVGHRGWDPFELLTQRFKYGDGARLRSALPSALLNPGSAPWQHRLTTPVAPPLPAGVAAEPATEDLAELADHFANGIAGLHCKRILKSPLDGSLRSLDALDSYLELLAPAAAPAEPEAPWAHPIALLAGAYYGQVLVSQGDGLWTPLAGTTDFSSHRVLVRGGEVSPIGEVHARLCTARNKKLSRGGPMGPAGGPKSG